MVFYSVVTNLNSKAYFFPLIINVKYLPKISMLLHSSNIAVHGLFLFACTEFRISRISGLYGYPEKNEIPYLKSVIIIIMYLIRFLFLILQITLLHKHNTRKKNLSNGITNIKIAGFLVHHFVLHFSASYIISICNLLLIYLYCIQFMRFFGHLVISHLCW